MSRTDSPLPGNAEPAAPPAFKPYVDANVSPPEFTPSAVILGILFGVFFGAVTVYLALKVGLTVSASIPIAVLSIVIYRFLGTFLGKGSILQNNIVQTTGSAGESIAAGVVFTLPALVFLGFEPSYWRVVSVALAGGWLGVLFMIPLRRYLIVREHGLLKYPEGTACAEVLIAGEQGGALGLLVLQGLGLGFAYSWFMKGFGFWNDTPEYRFGKWYSGGSVSAEITPELLGVGYIIGYRISAIMVAGGVLTYLVFIPLIKYFGMFLGDVRIFPGTIPIASMDPGDIRGAYVRYIGAGAVATGGILNVIRAMPVIVDSFRSSIGEMRGSSRPGGPVLEKARTDRDMPISLVAIGSAAIVTFLWVILTWVINPGHAVANVFAAVLMVVFGFLFVTVSSRLVGEIGSSSNPISGMTIATLMATCLIFVLVGWTGGAFSAVALCIGAVVCISAANAGATSQDLKTGYLLGATPAKQQVGLMLGVTFSTLVIGLTMTFMDRAYTTTVPASEKSIVHTFSESDLAGATRMTDNDVATLRLADEGGRGFLRAAAAEQPLLRTNVIGSKDVPDGVYIAGARDHKVLFVVVRGIGGPKLPAPQGQLMATVINGILTQKLPWNLILIGVFAALVLELCGVKSLPFAVGVYLPLSTTSPIFAGGLVKRLIDWRRGVKAGEEEGEASTGVLFSSGLIAGGALAGLAVAIVAMLDFGRALDFGLRWIWGPAGRSSGTGMLVAICCFLALVIVQYRVALSRGPGH